VDELCAGKVGGVGGAGQQQGPGDRQHRPQHRIGPGGLVQPRVAGLGQAVDGQCGGQPEQRGGGQVGPEFDEVTHGALPLLATRHAAPAR